MSYYGKLIDNRLEYAPKTVTKDRVHYNPYPVELLLQDGYKPLEMTPMPEQEEGYVWVAGWQEEEEAIVRTWHKEVAPPEEITADELADILMGGADE